MTPERDIRDDSSKWPKNGGGGIHRGFGTNNGNEPNGTRKPKIVDERNKNEIENNTAKSWNDNGANVSWGPYDMTRHTPRDTKITKTRPSLVWTLRQHSL